MLNERQRPTPCGRATCGDTWVFGLAASLVLGSAASAARAADEDESALTREECVALALKNGPAILIERERLHVAEADYAIARSALLPRLSGSAYYNRLDPDRLSPTGLSGSAGAPAPTLFVEEAFAGLRLRQLVIDGRSWPALFAADSGLEAQRASVEAARADTVYGATVAWTRLLEADSFVKVSQEAVTRQAEFEARTQAFFAAGKVPRLDKLKAESQRRDAERALHAARQAQLLAQALLRRALGIEDQQPMRAAGELLPEPTTPPEEGALLERALAKNHQLKRLQAQVDQANAAVWSAWGGHLPELSLQAGYGYRARDVGGEAPEYTAGAFLEVPLFSGLATSAAVKRATARKQELIATRRALQDQLTVDVREALTAWRVAAEAARFARQSIELNREAVVAAGSLYDAGKATALEVLTAQADLTRAEGTLVQALGDYAAASARLERIAGDNIEHEAQP